MKRIVITLAAAVFSLLACQKNDAPVVKHSGEIIRFSTNIATYNVKSTDTSLEENDQVGIFAGTPVSQSNVLYKVNGNGNLVSTTPLRWDAESTDDVEFTAYYPYDEDVTTTSISFAVETDQNAAGKFAASDLMAAHVAAATPGDEVQLVFTHQLHKIIVMINNSTTKTISVVSIKEVKYSADVELKTGAISNLAAENSTIIAAAKTAGSRYEAIIVPQNAKPAIVVTTSDGTTYTYAIHAVTEFAAGKTATATLALTEQTPSEGDPVEFSFTVQDWGENIDLVVDDPVVANPPVKKWGVIGLGNDWDNDIEMTCTAAGANEGEGTWEADITYAAGDEFKLRFDGAWDIDAGMKEGWTVYALGEFDDPYLAAGGGNIVLAAAGTYHVSFTYPTYRFIVTAIGGGDEPEPVPSVNPWKVVGTMNSWSYENGIEMTENEGVWECDIEYAAGDSFKFFDNTTWAGLKEGWTYYGTGAFDDGYLWTDGSAGNIYIGAEGGIAGDYHLAFNPTTLRLIITEVVPNP